MSSALRLAARRTLSSNTLRVAAASRGNLASDVFNVVQTRSFSYTVRPDSGEITGKYDNVHRSNAEELIAKVPVIEVDTDVAVCDGGGGSLGHPLEYIQLNTSDPTIPEVCKYCGLRYRKKNAH
mmetsp:Transcript_10106/g.17781  ORF Transcript_10106/g.17781 Transcript_10106/m.17781 type:complete len:124 (-) Transcript_10106:33-404(-)|eukprot:CAMPEP_0184533450 /NCGR_PEP_ID=MMETSP0198_2-20121128/14764_1 /TAXON_ID=1112570 /ORGANISM="Thraustochytrium sp., Strain LLF1b" /LENGTH=123 /DNA_ID=CAMNT_0026926229 /DNA_START=206 /DNA_END=574 /DNA_ORIENTATION=+